jgi:hypothetical protein
MFKRSNSVTGPSLAEAQPIFNHQEIKILFEMGLKLQIMVLFNAM